MATMPQEARSCLSAASAAIGNMRGLGLTPAIKAARSEAVQLAAQGLAEASRAKEKEADTLQAQAEAAITQASQAGHLALAVTEGVLKAAIVPKPGAAVDRQLARDEIKWEVGTSKGFDAIGPLTKLLGQADAPRTARGVDRLPMAG